MLLDTKYKRWLLRQQKWKTTNRDGGEESNSENDSEGHELEHIQD